MTNPNLSTITTKTQKNNRHFVINGTFDNVFKKVVGQPLRGWRHDKSGVVTRLEKQFKLKKSRNFQYGSKKFHVAPAQ